MLQPPEISRGARTPAIARMGGIAGVSDDDVITQLVRERKPIVEIYGCPTYVLL